MNRYCATCDRRVTSACWSSDCKMPDLPWTAETFPPLAEREPETVDKLQRYKLTIDRNDCPKIGCNKEGAYVKLVDVRKLVEKLAGNT